MSGREITIKATDGGNFVGYLSVPVGAGGPGIVVIQEIFGVYSVMQNISDDLVAEGYVELCPNLI